MSSLTSESIPYTCAVLNETLRLLTPIGANVRKSMIIFSDRIKNCVHIKLSSTEMSFFYRVATLPKNTELEISGIKMKNGFNVEIPYDLLHVHPGTDPRNCFITGNFDFLKKNSEIFERILGLKCSRVLPRKMVRK